ncbi:TetR family transcriptional regulator [Streptomyces sp. NPDC088736]|uniref:TetR family transcriptional regulator n=1 Tax=Streptomyces sp. NPDC088736 TaxID=3365881 RepID=UPI003815375A
MTGTERTASAARASAAHAGNSLHEGAGAVAGLSLTERRKAATRMEIARAAAELFMRHGLRATRAEDVARAAGVAPRTFYRYFASKEEALGPLFSAGAEKWAEAVRDAPAGLSVPDALRHAVVRTLTPGVGVRPESMEWVRSLLRLAEGSPALRRVWGEACQGAERTLVEVLAARLSPARDAVEAGAWGGAVPADGEASAGAVSGDAVSGGAVSGDAASGGAVSGGAGPYVAAAGVRFGAAVAGAAVRVAVETWAAGDDPADGPAGPVPRALNHLEALRDFPWDAV